MSRMLTVTTVVNEQNADCHYCVLLCRLQERDKESESLKQQLEAAKSVISKRRQQVEQLKLMHLELAGQCEKVAATSASACVRYGMVWYGVVWYDMVMCGGGVCVISRAMQLSKKLTTRRRHLVNRLKSDAVTSGESAQVDAVTSGESAQVDAVTSGESAQVDAVTSGESA